MNIYEIIQSVANTSSTKEKQAILERNKDNNILRLCFLYAENPRFNFYVKVRPAGFDYGGTNDISIATFYDLDKLIDRTYTGNAAREFINKIMRDLTPEAQLVLGRIINKDLRCNCGTAIANKVWKNLIPEYPVMLASKGDVKSMDALRKFGGPYIVQKKCDGGRVNVMVDAEGNVTYRSRNGNELELYGFFDVQFSKYKNMVFDGELLVRDEMGVADRKTGNGLYTKAVRGTLPKDEVSKMCMEIWDVIPIEEFNAGIGTRAYTDRLTSLLIMKFNPALVQVVESKKVNSLEECDTFYQRMRDQGEEGAIIKTASGRWEDKRSKHMVKLKAEETADLLCFAYEKGSGKYANMIGTLLCRTSCGKLVTGVGTGLNDADRARDPDYYLGKVIEVCYNEVIASKDPKVKTKSLFLPVYKQVRFDKDTANSLDELK